MKKQKRLIIQQYLQRTVREEKLMICRLFVFRHAETTDNARGIFSGWRDPGLTSKGLQQSRKIAEQLRHEKINYAFVSHLQRARQTLEIVLETHPGVPVFTDDRLIERCYGLLQGKSKRKVAEERPEWYAQVHRGYDFPPPEGESLRMVENRMLPFLTQLIDWLQQNPGNVAISCHGNSLRPIRQVFEHLSLKQMLELENPQDQAMAYALQLHTVKVEDRKDSMIKPDWTGILVPRQVKLATDTRNPLKKYY
ncbi:MAG TPA: histidine phosphatase family protein [Candidatus Acidoferrum sp.]|nr:histidine phosphatase family protein [Candidatus Acidoferrum sp.]